MKTIEFKGEAQLKAMGAAAPPENEIKLLPHILALYAPPWPNILHPPQLRQHR